MSTLNFADISTLFSQPTFALVELSSYDPIDLFTIWKFCALAVSGAKIAEQFFNIVGYLLDTEQTSDIKILFTFMAAIDIIFQIPYIKLSQTKDIFEFANDKLAQFIIVLDIINSIFIKGLFFLLGANSFNIISYLFDIMASFRAVGYLVVALNYMQ